MTDTNSTTTNAHESASFVVGSTVFGKYRIENFISSGAKGRVYKVRDTVLDNIVALKVLGIETDQHKDMVRFQSEAKMASRLQHPNIARVIDFGLWGSIPYLAMEYVDGKTVRAMLDATTTLELGDFYEIFSQVCYALDYAHMHGIVHRDIKPANIMVSNQESGGLLVKILDFGVAKRVDNIACMDGRLTPSGRIVGSPCYMSPEQSRGALVTQKSDNYSLGCFMWECLTGEPPFVGESVMETLLLQQNAAPGSLRERAKREIPDELADFVLGLLAKAPEDRPGLKSKVLPVLEQLSEAFNAVKHEEPPVEVTPPTMKHWKIPRLWILGGIAIGFVIVWSVLSLVNGGTPFPQSNYLGNMKNAVDGLYLVKDTRLTRLEENRSIIKLNCLATDDDLKGLIGNKAVTFLDISEADVTEKALQVVATLPNLETLRANWTHMTSLDGLQGLHRLRNLEVKSRNINDDKLKPITGLKLRVLDLSNCELTDRAFLDIAKITTLRELRLEKVQKLKFESMDALRGLPNLSSMDLSGTKVKPDTVRKLIAMCRKLKTIRIQNCPNIPSQEFKKLEEENPDYVFAGVTSLVNKYFARILKESERHQFAEACRLQTELIGFLERHDEHDDRMFGFYISNANLCIHSGRIKDAWYWQGKAKSLSAASGNAMEDVQVCELANNIEVVEAHGELSEELMDRFVKTLNRAEAIYKNDLLNLGVRFRTVADTLKVNGYRAQAWRYYTKGLDLFKNRKIDPKTTESLVLGSIYVHMGEFLREDNKFAESIKYYEAGLKVMEAFGPPYSHHGSIVANGYAGLATSYLYLHRPTVALKLSRRAVQLVNKHNLFGACKKYVYYDHATILIAMGRKAEAQPFLDESKKMWVHPKEGAPPIQ